MAEAVALQNMDLIKLLQSHGFETCELKVYSKNDQLHMRPITYASKINNLALVKFMIDNNFDLLEQEEDSEDLSPLIAAIQNENFEMAEFLIERGLLVIADETTVFLLGTTVQESDYGQLQPFLGAIYGAEEDGNEKVEEDSDQEIEEGGEDEDCEYEVEQVEEDEDG
jgi:ankyrin repeat protein